MRTETVGGMVGLLIWAAAAQAATGADSLVISGRTVKGIFRGIEQGRLVFEPEQGARMTEPIARIAKLTLDPARTVTLGYAGRKTRGPLRCKGYDKMKFLLEEKGKETSEWASFVVSMKVHEEASVDGGVGGREVVVDDLLIIDLKNLSDWMQGNTPTPAQTSAFEHYRTARQAYDAFVTKNAEMVAAMDKAQGGTRADLLNQLRQRREAEPPLRKAVKNAQTELLAAFPELKPDAGGAGKP